MTDDLVKRLREDQPVTQDMESTIQCALQDEAADRIEALTAERDALAAEVETAEQRGYANAMEAERKLHERRIGELEATLDKMAAALVELVIVPEAWMISGFPDIPSEAKEQIIASVMKARAALEEGKD